MHIVSINNPKINYDTIFFSWHTSSKAPFFKENKFFIKYKGMDIRNYPIDYWWYAFLAIMIPVYKYSKENVVFKFPSSVPKHIVELWINYHEANNIAVFPLEDVKYENNQLYKDQDTKVGILFGGGKDSTYALSVLHEIYGPENIILLSYILPYVDDIMEKHDKRRDYFLLNPIKKSINIDSQKIYTNFYSNMTELKYKYSTNMAIYYGTMLPVLQYYKINLLTFSYEFISYLTGEYNSNKVEFHFKRARFEFSNYVSNMTSSFVNAPVNIVNFNNYISEIGSFKVLAERYPEMLRNILMCEHTPQMKKWCHNCSKCGTYVFLNLCYGNKYLDIDIDDFLINSQYIKKLMKRTEKLSMERNEDNNYPWVPEFTNSFHFESHCHLIASIDMEKYKNQLSSRAFNNLQKIKDMYGNKTIPIHESFLEDAFKQVSPPLPNKVKEIVTNHCSPTNNIPDYFKIGNSKHVIDYSLSCNIPNIFTFPSKTKKL